MTRVSMTELGKKMSFYFPSRNQNRLNIPSCFGFDALTKHNH
jgi:hypothetical protein